MENLTWYTVLVAAVLASSSYALKCRSDDEKNRDDFSEVATMCLTNMSNFNRPGMNNNNKEYNSGRYNNNRNRDSYGGTGNMDNNHDSMYNRNNRNYNGDNDNNYGMWRRQQQTSGGYGFNDNNSDSQQNTYFNPRTGLRSKGGQDKNNQRKSNNNNSNNSNNDNSNNDNINNKNNSTNSTLDLYGNSPLELVEACVIQCIFQEMHMLDDSSLPDKSLVTKVMTKRIRDPKVRDFIEDSIDDCFELLESDNKRSNCEFSKNLALCLEEKGRRNCDDWEDQSDMKSSNNRNSKNPKRPN